MLILNGILKKVFKKKNKVIETSNILSVNDQLKKDYYDYWSYGDITEYEEEIIRLVRPFTMTSPERIISLIRATQNIIENNIPGDFVECGVWKGGSIMIIAKILVDSGITNKKLYLYDTFEGMAEPEGVDESTFGDKAIDTFKENQLDNSVGSNWCYSTLDEVKGNLSLTEYPAENIIFVKGKVEETIPSSMPTSVSLLRLDTDWYSSTIHEMNYLFPLISKGGFLIIDDYGHWKGSRQAIDEYLKEHNKKLFLNRVDYSCRLIQIN